MKSFSSILPQSLLGKRNLDLVELASDDIELSQSYKEKHTKKSMVYQIFGDLIPDTKCHLLMSINDMFSCKKKRPKKSRHLKEIDPFTSLSSLQPSSCNLKFTITSNLIFKHYGNRLHITFSDEPNPDFLIDLEAWKDVKDIEVTCQVLNQDYFWILKRVFGHLEGLESVTLSNFKRRPVTCSKGKKKMACFNNLLSIIFSQTKELKNIGLIWHNSRLGNAIIDFLMKNVLPNTTTLKTLKINLPNFILEEKRLEGFIQSIRPLKDTLENLELRMPRSLLPITTLINEPLEMHKLKRFILEVDCGDLFQENSRALIDNPLLIMQVLEKLEIKLYSFNLSQKTSLMNLFRMIEELEQLRVLSVVINPYKIGERVEKRSDSKENKRLLSMIKDSLSEIEKLETLFLTIDQEFYKKIHEKPSDSSDSPEILRVNTNVENVVNNRNEIRLDEIELGNW